MKKYLGLVLLLFFHYFLLSNVQFTAWPEMLAFPYLVGSGYSLYQDLVHPYPPLLPLLLLGIYSLLGLSVTSLQIFTWSLVLVNDVLVFLLVYRLTNKKIYASLGLFCYVILHSLLEGNMMWYDNALVTPLLAAIFFLTSNLKRKYLYTGAFLLVATLIKQTGILFFVVTFIYLAISEKKLRILFNLSLPVVIGWSVLAIFLLVNQEFEWFWNWTVAFPLEYWSAFPGYVKMTISKNDLFVLLGTLLPILLLFKAKFKYAKIILLFAFTGLLAVYPRFSFFHFQPALAFAVIGTAIALRKYMIFYFLGVLILGAQYLQFFWGKETRFFSAEDVRISRSIVDLTSNSQSIYLLGIHSGHYVMGGYLPPKPWFDNYGWYFEIPNVKEAVIKEWQNNMPDYIISQDPNSGDWYEIGVYQPKEIVDWINTNYKQVGQVGNNVKVMQKIQ